MKKLVSLAAVACALLMSVSARADDKTIVLHDYIVYGRYLHPIAVTDTGKLPMKLTLTELKQPFVGRIEQPVQSSPF